MAFLRWKNVVLKTTNAMRPSFYLYIRLQFPHAVEDGHILFFFKLSFCLTSSYTDVTTTTAMMQHLS